MRYFDHHRIFRQPAAGFPYPSGLLAALLALIVILVPTRSSGQSVRFSETFGGSVSDTVFAVTHHEGFTYVAGRTSSADFPVTDGSTFRGDTNGVGDIFVAKLNAEGQIVAATLLGGSGPDFANGITVSDGPDGSASPKTITISGWTGSTDFRTLNPIQAANGGKTDAVIAQFDQNLVLLFSTYLGGAEDDQFSGLTPIVNNAADGDLMFFGFTTSTDFPFPVPNAADPTTTVKNLTNNADGLLVRMSRSRTLPMASLLRRTSSGNGTQNEVILAGTSGLIFPASFDSPAQYGLYVTGWTDNDFFRHSSDPSGSGKRIFLTEINPENGGRIYSRVLGGSGDDVGQAVAITAHGVVVLGQTTSTDLPDAQSLFQAAPGGGTDTVLVGWQHLPSDLPLFARPAYVAYLGGSGEDSGRALSAAFGPQFPQSAVADHLHFAGVTGSSNLPLPASPQHPAAQATYGGGATDGFFGRLAVKKNPESTGPVLLLEAKDLTFDGGSDDDAFTSVAAIREDATEFESIAGGAIRVIAGKAVGRIRSATTSRERARVTYYGKASSGSAADLAVAALPRGPLAPGVEEVLVLVITNKGSIQAQSIVLGVVSDQIIGAGPTAEIIRATLRGQPDGLLGRDGEGRFLLGDLSLEPGSSVEVDVTVRSLAPALQVSPPEVGLSVGVFDRGGFVADENPQDNSIMVELAVAVSPDLRVELLSATQDSAGATPRRARYEFRISNVGTAAAENAEVVLRGLNLTGVTYQLAGGDPSGLDDLDGTVDRRIALGTVGFGTAKSLVVTGEVVRLNLGTQASARAAAAGDLNPENDLATGETGAPPLPDLTVLMEARPPFIHGREEVLTLVITNQGARSASGIMLSTRPVAFDDMGDPKDITAEITRITFNGATLGQVAGQPVHTVSLGELVLEPGASIEIDFALKSLPDALTQSPPAVHVATVVDSREADSDEINNSRRFVVPVEFRSSDLTLSLGAPSAPVPSGTPFSFIVQVVNAGPDAGDAVVKLFFDPNLGISAAPPACSPVGPDEAWIINAFREIYGRRPTGPELSEALDLIRTTGNRQAVAQTMLGSTEYHGFQADRLYLALRGIPPTEAELASAVARLDAGTLLAVLAKEILLALPAASVEVVTGVESAKVFLGESPEETGRRIQEAVSAPDFALAGYLQNAVTQDLLNLWVPGKTLEELIAPTDPQAVIYRCELQELPSGGQVSLPFDLTPQYPGDYVVDGEVAGGQEDPTPVNDRAMERIEVAGPQDFGDAPTAAVAVPGFPPVPGGYPTLLAGNGARHGVDPRLGLGLLTDAEAEGQQDPSSLGDDLLPATSDDEDGVGFLVPFVPVNIFAAAPSLGQAGDVVAVNVRARVPADKIARVSAWVDFNRDGDWNDAGEQVIASSVVKSGVTRFTFVLPAGLSPGISHSRFRLSTTSPLSPSGASLDGEVEDHIVVLGGLDRGDAPVPYGDAPHIVPLFPGNFLGARVDPDPVQPSADARADDSDLDGDDEDGLIAPGPFFAGVESSLTLTASEAGFVDFWLDYNGINGFERVVAAPAPTEYVNASIVGLPAGSPPAPFPVNKGRNVIRFRVPDRLVGGLSFLRVRYTSIAAPGLGPVDLAPDGEVEDYRVQLYPLAPDFGDAPDSLDQPLYPTLLAHNGAFHLITEDGFFLGRRVDIEPDGFPGLDALGDDQDDGLENPDDPEPDDEDGVLFLTTLMAGGTARVQLVVTSPNSEQAFVNAWVDFNADFDWADAGEQVLVDAPVANGTNLVNIAVPAGAHPGNTYARFRLSRDRGLGYSGVSTGGEVEDYPVNVIEQAGGLFLRSITAVGSDIELRWDGDSALESAPSINGPWTRETGATSPFRAPVGASGAVFYRLVRP